MTPTDYLLIAQGKWKDPEVTTFTARSNNISNGGANFVMLPDMSNTKYTRSSKKTSCPNLNPIKLLYLTCSSQAII